MNRDVHGRALKKQLERIREQLERRGAIAPGSGVEAPKGFFLEFESPPNFHLKLESLEFGRTGIELLATRMVGNRQFATVFVPQGRLTFFVKRVERYLTELHGRSGKPRNNDLVQSIAEVRLAVAESFWTDPADLLPARSAVVWWEVWLRGTPDEVVDRFTRIAQLAKIEVADEVQTFIDRTVMLARCSLEQFASTIEILDVLAELRRVQQIGSFFTRLDPSAQVEWVRELVPRLRTPTSNAVAVTILDSGISRAHPLISPFLDRADTHTCRPAWGAHDHLGHGTEMAGVAVYGDLRNALLAQGPWSVSHRLESVKIVPPSGHNPEHLFGAITADGVALVEIQAPSRSRVFSMSISAKASERGEPTGWSAGLDKLSCGEEDGSQRLFVVCAGNVGPGAGKNYPAQNSPRAFTIRGKPGTSSPSEPIQNKPRSTNRTSRTGSASRSRALSDR